LIPPEDRRLPQLEPLGDAVAFAGALHGMVGYSPLIENLTAEEIQKLARFIQVYRAPGGEVVIREGEPGDFMMFIIEGRVEVFKQDRQKLPRMIAVVEAGQTLGEMSMIDGEPRFATCVAAAPTLVGVLTRENLARVVLEEPLLGAKVLMELIVLMSNRLRTTSARLVQSLEQQVGTMPGPAEEGSGLV
jgi:CRP-like cAMP-binding protein